MNTASANMRGRSVLPPLTIIINKKFQFFELSVMNEWLGFQCVHLQNRVMVICVVTLHVLMHSENTIIYSWAPEVLRGILL